MSCTLLRTNRGYNFFKFKNHVCTQLTSGVSFLTRVFLFWLLFVKSCGKHSPSSHSTLHCGESSYYPVTVLSLKSDFALMCCVVSKKDLRVLARSFRLMPLLKTPLPSCSSHAGLLSHLSLRRRRAVPAGMIENGNSGPRRSGKFQSEHGWWRAQNEGQSPAIPRHEQGCRIFPPS